MSTKSLLVIIIVVLVILLGAYWTMGHTAFTQLGGAPEITSFTVERPNLVARGSGFSKVEVWAVPTGTEITENDHVKLGDAASATECKTVPCKTDTWVFPIPKDPFLASDIYAKGFDSMGKEYKKSLNVTGATEIYNTLWMTAPSLEKSLKVGESMSFEDISLKLNKITEDSRCPVGVQCIQAGRVTTSVTLATSHASTTQDITTDDEGVSFENFFVRITNVKPEAKQQGAADFSQYEITFSIEKDIKL